ncbi:MAG: serine protease [Gammaproteobacteria bacterium]|nr:serine protease [Gammaproteobacteria bacterium]MBU2180111.1 serine protease [Gammaproteobacteria bacterium]MBU2223405.1 serine protease [Gammaproteobacteria bacterium]MBU2426662.1 serine protease [Gammaproteobacteria bacterium]
MQKYLFLISMLCSGILQAADLVPLLAQVKPAVVAIGIYNPTAAPRLKLIGSGFAVSPGNRIATNFHVVEKTLNSSQNENYVVLSGNGPSPTMHRIQHTISSREHDLALLSIEQKLPYLQLAIDDLIPEGSEIAFTGYPITGVLGLYPATHRGIISAITPIAIPADHSTTLNPRTLRLLQQPFMVYQLDATAYPGNSGSAVYRQTDGKVVAIINMVLVKSSREAVLSDPSGISYAIPVTHLHQLLQKID